MMERKTGAMKFHLWQFLRGQKACEDDRCPELKRRWDKTMSRFLEERQAA